MQNGHHHRSLCSNDVFRSTPSSSAIADVLCIRGYALSLDNHTSYTVNEGPACCSLNAIVAQFRNCPSGVNTIEQKNVRTVSDNKGL